MLALDHGTNKLVLNVSTVTAPSYNHMKKIQALGNQLTLTATMSHSHVIAICDLPC